VVQEHYPYTRNKESMRKGYKKEEEGDKESMNKKNTKIV
jgi:hypothetical protein